MTSSSHLLIIEHATVMAHLLLKSPVHSFSVLPHHMHTLVNYLGCIGHLVLYKSVIRFQEFVKKYRYLFGSKVYCCLA